jgi:hypothetical protein
MKLKELYLLIEQQALNNLSDVQYIDLQKRQIERATENYPIPFPALLVEFGAADHSNLSRHRQIGSSDVSITFYMDLVTDTHDDAQLRDETIQLLDLPDRLFQTFEGLKVSDTTMLIRKSDTGWRFEGNYCWITVTFSFVQYEKKNENTRPLKITAGLNVESKKQ